MNNRKDNSADNKVLGYFIVFFLGCMVSLLLVHHLIIKKKDERQVNLVTNLVYDVKSSMKEGSMLIADQCKDLGYAYIPTSETAGIYIKCDQSTIYEVAGNEATEYSKEVKVFAAKRMKEKQ